MSALGEAIGAVREALRLADDVKRVGDTIKDVSKELREHDRRITRLEAKWRRAKQKRPVIRPVALLVETLRVGHIYPRNLRSDFVPSP